MIFISYSRRDISIAKQLVDEIKTRTSIDCWIDLKGIESADKFQDVIVNAIDRSGIVLFLISKNSMQSSFAKKEVLYAKNTGKRIIPVCVDDTPMSGWFLFEFGDVDYIVWKDKEQRGKLLDNLCNVYGVTAIEPNRQFFGYTVVTKIIFAAEIAIFCIFLSVCFWCGWVKGSYTLSKIFGTKVWNTLSNVYLYRWLFFTFLVNVICIVVIYYRKIWWPVIINWLTVFLVSFLMMVNVNTIGLSLGLSYIKWPIAMLLLLLYVCGQFVLTYAIFAPNEYKAFEPKFKHLW